MKLAECNLGKIVVMKPPFRLDERFNIGHIAGLTANSVGEVIPLVLFACQKEPVGIHYHLLEDVGY
jgi:hypothetical protein